MNFLKNLVVAGLLFSTSLQAQIAGDTFLSSRSSKSANVTYVFNNATAFAKRDEQGKVSGVLVDLMGEFETYVLEEHGISMKVDFVEIEQANFAKFLSSVETSKGGVFGLSNASITEERKKRLLFSPPFIKNITVLVTHNSVPTLASLREIGVEFNEMKAYSVTSSIYLAKLEELKSSFFPNMEIELYKSGLGVIEALAKEREAFAVIDLLYYLDFLKKGYPIKRHKSGDEVGDEFGIVMPKSNDWAPVLEEFLNSGFLKSPEYRKIVSDHLGKSAIRLIE